MSLPTPTRSASSAASTPASLPPSASVSQRGSQSSSTRRPPLQPRWTSSSGASSYAPSSRRQLRDRAFSIESVATTRPALRTTSGRVITTGGERGAGAPIKLATRPGDVDLLQLRPDSPADHGGVDALFVQFAVKEIRHVEDRARGGAEAKREELRLMVGERYRDLLSAADSIVRMRKSATTLLTRLEVAQHDCTHDELNERARSGRRANKAIAGPSRTPYTTATLVKLLLDSPEHVWRAIERHDFLAAARLEAIARAVYRSLAGSVEQPDGAEEEEEELTSTFPLVEQQWENILQLGPQIIARAKAALQQYDMSTQDTVDTLAAIVMVENITLPDALSLLLDQRSRSLDSVLHPPAATPHTSPTVTRKVSLPLHSGSIEDTLLHAVNLVMQTVEHVKQAFITQPNSSTLLLDLLEDLQVAPDGPAASPEVNRRLSAGFAAEVPGGRTARVSILESLPNAHTLFRYLPPQVLTFTPFISTASPPEAVDPETQLSTWLTITLEHLRSGFEQTLTSVTSAGRLVTLRSSLLDLWQLHPASAEAVAVRSALNEALEARFTQTYEAELAKLVEDLPQSLRQALIRLPTAVEDLDVNAYVYASSLPFPSTSAVSALSAADLRSPFHSFDEAIDKRLSGRTPLIDRVLRQLENAAEALHDDLHGWLDHDDAAAGGTLARYREAVGRTFEALVASLRDSLGEAAGNVSSSTFIGAFARCLSETSDFAEKLVVQDVDSDAAASALATLTTSLAAVTIDSLRAWHEAHVAAAVGVVQASLVALAAGDLDFDSSSYDESKQLPNGHSESAAPLTLPTTPSSSLSLALYSLVTAINPRRTNGAAARKLVTEFGERAAAVVTNQLETVSARQGEAIMRQILFDIVFLRALVGQEGLSPAWTAAIEALQAKIGPSYAVLRGGIDGNADVALRRQQTLLASLLPPQSSTAALLPLGPATVPSEFRSPLGVAAPGPRLGLVPILAGGSR